VKKNNTYPLVFRISEGGVYRDIGTGQSVQEHQYNLKTESVRNTHPLHELINSQLKELKLKYLSKLMEYEKTHFGTNTPQQIKDYLLGESISCMTVNQFWDKEISLILKAGRNGGARIYMEVKVAINKVKSLDIRFEQVDYNFLKDLEAELLGAEVKVNSISLYLRTLRAIYNKAINSGVVSFHSYPFRSFKIKKERGTPLVMTLEELRAFFQLNVNSNDLLYDSWLMGKLMFLLMGINITDMLMMKHNQVVGGRLIYSRTKTKRRYSIKLVPEALTILEYFQAKKSNTVIGKLSERELEDGFNLPLVLRQRNQVFNSHLMKLGKRHYFFILPFVIYIY